MNQLYQEINGMRTLSKLMLNSLYGKFATATHGASQKPYIENDILTFKTLPEEERNRCIFTNGNIYYKLRKRKNNKNFTSY